MMYNEGWGRLHLGEVEVNKKIKMILMMYNEGWGRLHLGEVQINRKQINLSSKTKDTHTYNQKVTKDQN